MNNENNKLTNSILAGELRARDVARGLPPASKPTPLPVVQPTPGEGVGSSRPQAPVDKGLLAQQVLESMLQLPASGQTSNAVASPPASVTGGAESASTKENSTGRTNSRSSRKSGPSQPRTEEEIQEVIEKEVTAIKDTYYDNSNRLFWRKTADGGWLTLSRRDLETHLASEGFSPRADDGERLSGVERLIVHIQNHNYVHLQSSIGGYHPGVIVVGDMRILITSGPTFIKPCEGGWSMLYGVLVRMFGEEQLCYLFGWIKISLAMFESQSWMAGQVLALCGPPQSGKNLFASILKDLFGGRLPGKPYGHMTGSTDFNADLVGKELLTIEDEVSLSTLKARRDMGAKIKELAVNDVRKLHPKGAQALSVVPLQRLVISLNDEPERMQVLPPLDSDIKDKIMLMKIFKHEMPMSTKTPVQRRAFNAALLAQLPAFVHFLDTWQIPEHLVGDRYGIVHYHHPELVEALQETSPEDHLLALIDEELFEGKISRRSWDGMANELTRTLKNSTDPNISYEAKDLLKGPAQCGHYLGRLANKVPDRVMRLTMNGGSQKWEIYRQRTDKDKAVLAKLRALLPEKNPPQESATPDLAELVLKWSVMTSTGGSGSSPEPQATEEVGSASNAESISPCATGGAEGDEQECNPPSEPGAEPPVPQE